jgi:hypothetical protein
VGSDVGFVWSRAASCCRLNSGGKLQFLGKEEGGRERLLIGTPSYTEARQRVFSGSRGVTGFEDKEDIVHVQWSDRANRQLGEIGRRDQNLWNHMQANVRQWAQNNGGNWQQGNTYSHSFRAGAYHYRAEYAVRMNGNVPYISVELVEMD